MIDKDFILLVYIAVVSSFLLFRLVSAIVKLLNIHTFKVMNAESREILDIIDRIVIMEVFNIIKPAKMTDERYKPLNFDEDIKNISIATYKAFKSSFMKSNLIIFNESYLYQYIIRKATDELVSYINSESRV